MPRQLWIDDHIEYRGDAAHRSNVDGPEQPTMVHFHDHFLGDTLDTNLYTVTVAAAGDDISIQPAVGGQCRFTTSSTDQASEFLATALNFEDDMSAVCEARIKIANVSAVALFFGFNDATTETTPAMPIDYAGGTLASAAGDQNAVGFVVDADKLTSSIYAVGCAAGTLDPAGGTDMGVDWEDGEWHTLRVELTPAGYAYFYLDEGILGGGQRAFIDAAVTSGTALCMMMACATRNAEGSTYVYLDRWDAWQNQGE